MEAGVIVSGAVEVEAGGVEFAAGEGEAVGGAGAGNRRVAERLEGIRSLRRAGGIGQRERAAEGIRQEIARARGIRAVEVFVHATSEQIRRSRRAGDFLHGIHAVVEELRHAANGLADAPPKGIVLEARRHASTDRNQLIPRVPGVGVRSIARQVAVGVVAEVRAFPVRKLIC